MYSKLKYFIRSVLHQFDQLICPFCHGKNIVLVKRKYFFTQLRKCDDCKLLFRTPRDPDSFNHTFYQNEYEENDRITTQLPTDEELRRLLNGQFVGTGKDIKRVLDILESIWKADEKPKILDYGASWGYISYQLIKEGYNIQSYEISVPRAKFGNLKLGLAIKVTIDELERDNDVFFSSHVIEHVPFIQEMMKDAQYLTKNNPNTFFIALCPNGSFSRMKIDASEYHKNWGLAHPNFLDDQFFQKLFARNPYYVVSSPYNMENLKSWDQDSQILGNMQGDELLVICKFKENVKNWT